MKLSLRCDYGFRLLTVLALEPQEALSVADAASKLKVSSNHLAKLVQDLARLEFVETIRGRGGGVRLHAAALDRTLGDVVRALEPLELVECFDPETNTCVLTGGCRLHGILDQARRAFLEELDQHTVADLVQRRSRLRRLVTLG